MKRSAVNSILHGLAYKVLDTVNVIKSLTSSSQKRHDYSIVSLKAYRVFTVLMLIVSIKNCSAFPNTLTPHPEKSQTPTVSLPKQVIKSANERVDSLSTHVTITRAQRAIDQSQENVSQRLHRFSTYLDKFFADESYVQESQDSRMRVSLITRFEENEDPSFQPRLNLSLSLPNTENRMRLRFQSNDELDTEDDNNVSNNLNESVNNTTFSSALGLILLANEKIDIRADIGVKLRNPLDTFSQLRFRKSFQFDDSELRVTETLEWRKSQGKTAETLLEFEYPFNEEYFFRSRSEATYADKKSFWLKSQSLTLYDKLSTNSAIAYSIGATGQNEDTLHTKKKDQVNDYWIETRYRKTFYKNWLSYEITPGLSHPRELEFKSTPRIEFRLEALYGVSNLPSY